MGKISSLIAVSFWSVLIMFLLVSCTDTTMNSLPLYTEAIDYSTPLPAFHPSTSPSSDVTDLQEETQFVVLPVDLSVYCTDIENGFTIEYKESETIQTHVSQTWVSPKMDGLSYGVHVLTTRGTYNSKLSFVQRDAVVVNPETGEFKTYPLYHNLYQNNETNDEFAEGYGFADERFFIYIAMTNEEVPHRYRYQIMKLDILTGEKSTIVADVRELADLEGYANNWMNESSDTLVFNSFNKGMLGKVNLNTGEWTSLAEGIRHSWPFYMTSIAPDGESFWHTSLDYRQFRLYSKEGQFFKALPFGDNAQARLVLWSPRGQFAYLNYTSENNEIVEQQDHTEFMEIATEQIFVYDRNGQERGVLSSHKDKRYIELLGWASYEQETAIVHTYSWESFEGVVDQYEELGRKIRSEFQMYDPELAVYQKLKLVKDVNLLKQPRAVLQHHYGTLYAVDRELGLIAEVSSNGTWVDSGNPEELVYVVNDGSSGEEQTYVLHKGAENGSTPFQALDLRPYKMTEGKVLSRDSMSYMTIQ
ncbi:hypothetical protein [Paenibacillus paeoniae]|uniref:Uncharacterized protein n=1 Tax=Paenibacillus paeoniae TaxID=2292705 RepID=A0A371PHC4_9BACL|nr:hypothetical protein [Paenibacillus paeoniae]REK75611.1 hypothetical protein DX130_00520 [Paenibacillus paeoniae]